MKHLSIIVAALILGTTATAHAVPITIHTEKTIPVEREVVAHDVVRGDPLVAVARVQVAETVTVERVEHVAPVDEDDDGIADAEDDCVFCEPTYVRSSGTGGYSGDGAHAAAVSGYSLEYPSMVECESGGDPNVYDSTGTYWGLGQFDQQTWDAYAPSGEWGSATPAEQIAAIEAVPYDAWPNC